MASRVSIWYTGAMRSNRHHMLVLGLYLLLSLALSWPLLPKITTHVPGIAQWAFDESTFIWNIWHLKHAVVEQLRSPLHTELIWYPLGIDLILYTYNFYHALVALPLALAVNLPFGSNITLLSNTVLSGYGVYLLVYHLLARHRRLLDGERKHLASPFVPGLIAGLLFAFASNRSIYAALGHYDMVTTQWIPFYALMLLRSFDISLPLSRRRKAAVLAGLFFALTGLAEMIIALFLAIFTVIAVVVHVRRIELQSTGDVKVLTHGAQSLFPGLWSLLGMLAITGLVAFTLWSPVLIPILHQFLTDDFSLQGWGEAIPLSADLLGWFTPTVLHPVWGDDLVSELRRVQLLALAEDGVGFRDVNTVFIGYCSLALAVIGAVRYRRRVAIWIWTTVIFGLFTLGPFLQINGHYRFDLDGIETSFPLPFALLHYLPIIKANRAPNRNSVLFMLGIAVLAGFALFWLFEKMKAGKVRNDRLFFHLRSPIAAILAGAILFEHLALPSPLSDARVPDVYWEIAADPRPVSVMHSPLGWRNSFGVFGPEETRLQYYQSVHGKPMLGGNISRAPDFKLDYFKRIPYFQALTEIEFGREVEPSLLELARQQGRELAYLYNIGYVLLHPPIPQRYPYADTWQQSWAFLKETLPLEPQPFWVDNGIEAYRLLQPAGADHFELDLGMPGTFPYRGEGWDAAETDSPYESTAIWATAPSSRLFIPLRQVAPDATYSLALRIHPFAFPGSQPQTVQAVINQNTLETHQLAGGWQEVAWQIPGSMLVDGLNRVVLHWGYIASPRQVLPGSRQIGSTGAELPIDADLKSFATGGFIALFDEEEQQIDASAGRRGVNITVLHPESGAVVDKVGFDTAANTFESEAMTAFGQAIAPGYPVLVVAYGDATAHLTDEAIDVLRNLGAEISLEQIKGQYFAIAGVQGAEPGSAAVVLHPEEAFLRISLEPDRRTLAGAVDWLRIERTTE